jgi:hypothetical protein
LRDHDLHWDWFVGEEYFAMDEREYAEVNYGMLPAFEPVVIREASAMSSPGTERGSSLAR